MKLSTRKRRISPITEAQDWVRAKCDKPGLQPSFIDEYKGKYYRCNTDFKTYGAWGNLLVLETSNSLCVTQLVL